MVYVTKILVDYKLTEGLYQYYVPLLHEFLNKSSKNMFRSYAYGYFEFYSKVFCIKYFDWIIRDRCKFF